MNKQKARNEIAVGIFLIIAVFVLVMGVLWGKGSSLFTKAQIIQVRFADVTGLEKGDPVVVRGLDMGKVSDISLETGAVLVTLSIGESLRLNSDMHVWITGRDLLGGKQVTLDPGDSGIPLDPGKIVSGAQKGDLMALMTRAELLITQIDSTFLQIRPILASGQIQKVMTDLDLILIETQSLIKTVKPKWIKTSERIETASRQLEGDSTLVKINRLTGQMEKTLSGFDRLTKRIENQEGTLGKLVRDRQLYTQLVKTTQEMDSLITDIKTNPKRYVHVSLF